MGFLQLLRFTLFCVDFLAWPAVALGYPLLASVRAIETGSKYHLKKLVVYWTLFSLISLFESGFVKIIEWIPFWSSVKLLTMVWLVFPRFHGACYAYRSFIRPYLVANLQEVIGIVCKPKEEVSQTEERFLDVADKYIKENGYEVSEKLIAGKGSYMMILNESNEMGTRVIEPVEKNVTAASKQVVFKVPYNSQMDTRLIEPVEKNVQTVSKQLEEPAQKGKEKLEDLYMIASPEAKQVPRPRLLTTASWPPKQASTASAKTKDTVITPPPENEQPTAISPPPLKKTELEWACRICQLTTTCEKNLSDHFRGKKHKSKCESLNSSNHLNARDKVTTSGEVTTSDNTDQNAVRDGSKFELQCDVCDLKLLSEVDVGTHLQGKRHASNLRRLEKVEDVVL